MRFFDGYTLRNLGDFNAKNSIEMSNTDTLKILRYLYGTLRCIHSHGLAHRDINVENVMFNRKEIKIIDYGTLCKVGNCYSANAEDFGNAADKTILAKSNDITDLTNIVVMVTTGYRDLDRNDKHYELLKDIVTNVKYTVKRRTFQPPKYSLDDAIQIIDKNISSASLKGVFDDFYDRLSDV